MIIKKIESILKLFNVAFSRQSSFYWFILICFAFIIRDDFLGVTSFVRTLGLHPSNYQNILSFFCYSKAYCVDSLCLTWFSTQTDLHCIDDKIVLVIDGIKIPKSGNFMPAKRLHHQESKNKPKFIMGHYFGAVCAVICKKSKFLCVPICFKIQDGLRFAPNSKETLTSKMFHLVESFSNNNKAFILCDAFFVSMKYIRKLKKNFHDLISRVKMSTVAYKILEDGSKTRVKLQELFNQQELFTEYKVNLYGKLQQIKLYQIDLFYHELTVRFVLSIFENGKLAIFLSTTDKLSEVEIIEAYVIRFKIEVSFKTLIYSLRGFVYHFWSQYIEKIKSGQKNMYLHRADKYTKEKVKQKVEAYNRFVCIAGIVLGILQIVAIDNWQILIDKNPFYFRKMSKAKIPSIYMVRKIIREMYIRNFSRIMATPVFGKVLRSKGCAKPDKKFWI